MQIACSKSNLLDNMNLVMKAVSSRTTLPILECVLLVADDNGFFMTATDLELGVETDKIDAMIIDAGCVALNAKMFHEIIRKFPEDTVTINVDDKNVTTLRCQKSEFKILGQSGEEFPTLPLVERSEFIPIGSRALKNMIRQTIFSVAVDETKNVMRGELLEVKNRVLKLVSVDGFRISYRECSLENFEGEAKIIIPGKALSVVSKLLNDNDDEISIFYTDKHALFALGGCTFVTRLLDGEFINYENLFNSEYNTQVFVERTQLLSSLDRASLISVEAKKTPILLSISSGKILITANTEMGTVHDEVEVDIEGSDIDIAFNPRYMIEALRVIEDEKVLISFVTSLSPCVIRPEKESSYKYLILPLRIKA